jgi:hypothetical protein
MVYRLGLKSIACALERSIRSGNLSQTENMILLAGLECSLG